MLTHLDLFSGIGGFALAAEWAGFTTIGFVEIDKYCQKVLRRHWPDVSIVEDIRDVEAIKEVVANATRERLPDGRGPSLADPRSPDPEFERCHSKRSGLQEPSGQYRSNRTIPESITVITGGFPCQPFSVAGKRGGKADDRYLWPEMLRVIEEVRPRWVLGENVAGIVRMELDTCLSDLERIGYTTQAFVIPACAVNAPHRRDRIWIVAHDKYIRFIGHADSGQGRDNGKSSCLKVEQCGSIMADPTDREPQRSRTQCHVRGLENQVLRNCRDSNYWAVEPELGRVAHGIPNRVDRLKCLGNAIVPQVAYQILKGVAEIETNLGYYIEHTESLQTLGRYS